MERPDCFRDPANSPIAILTDDRDIAAAQAEEAARRKLNKQLAPDVRVGVLAADPYLGMLARDAVRFADQSLGIYNRHIGEPGCVIMPKIGDHIVLIRIFRHATRDWAWEFPGGRISPGEDPDITALHELEEEIGAIRPSLQALGDDTPLPRLLERLYPSLHGDDRRFRPTANRRRYHLDRHGITGASYSKWWTRERSRTRPRLPAS